MAAAGDLVLLPVGLLIGGDGTRGSLKGWRKICVGGAVARVVSIGGSRDCRLTLLGVDGFAHEMSAPASVLQPAASRLDAEVALADPLAEAATAHVAAQVRAERARQAAEAASAAPPLAAGDLVLLPVGLLIGGGRRGSLKGWRKICVGGAVARVVCVSIDGRSDCRLTLLGVDGFAHEMSAPASVLQPAASRLDAEVALADPLAEAATAHVAAQVRAERARQAAEAASAAPPLAAGDLVLLPVGLLIGGGRRGSLKGWRKICVGGAVARVVCVSIDGSRDCRLTLLGVDGFAHEMSAPASVLQPAASRLDAEVALADPLAEAATAHVAAQVRAERARQAAEAASAAPPLAAGDLVLLPVGLLIGGDGTRGSLKGWRKICVGGAVARVVCVSIDGSRDCRLTLLGVDGFAHEMSAPASVLQPAASRLDAEVALADPLAEAATAHVAAQVRAERARQAAEVNALEERMAEAAVRRDARAAALAPLPMASGEARVASTRCVVDGLQWHRQKLGTSHATGLAPVWLRLARDDGCALLAADLVEAGGDLLDEVAGALDAFDAAGGRQGLHGASGMLHPRPCHLPQLNVNIDLNKQQSFSLAGGGARGRFSEAGSTARTHEARQEQLASYRGAGPALARLCKGCSDGINNGTGMGLSEVRSLNFSRTHGPNKSWAGTRGVADSSGLSGAAETAIKHAAHQDGDTRTTHHSLCRLIVCLKGRGAGLAVSTMDEELLAVCAQAEGGGGVALHPSFNESRPAIATAEERLHGTYLDEAGLPLDNQTKLQINVFRDGRLCEECKAGTCEGGCVPARLWAGGVWLEPSEMVLLGHPEAAVATPGLKRPQGDDSTEGTPRKQHQKRAHDYVDQASCSASLWGPMTRHTNKM